MDIEGLLKSLNAHSVRYVVKEAAGRPKDLEDLRALRRLRDGRG